MSIIHTDRLMIREWQESDAQDLYEICLDPELRRCGVGFYDNVGDALKSIRHAIAGNGMKAIICKNDNRLIGMIGLCDMNRYDGYKELDYAIAFSCRNKGYATEAINAVLKYAFVSLDIMVVSAWVRSHNVASARVLEKCGFTFEGRLRKHARDRSDTLCYSVLKEEWTGD